MNSQYIITYRKIKTNEFFFKWYEQEREMKKDLDILRKSDYYILDCLKVNIEKDYLN